MRTGIFVFNMLWLVWLSGCTTIDTVSDKNINNKIFSGTIRHVELACAHAVCIDAPFSFAADVVLLPVTVPWSIYNATTKDSATSSSAERTNEVPASLERPKTE